MLLSCYFFFFFFEERQFRLAALGQFGFHIAMCPGFSKKGLVLLGLVAFLKDLICVCILFQQAT